MTTLSMQEKFSNVRKRLDQLGYKQPLSYDCLPLVEKLFSDLVWTTENLRKIKTEFGSQLKLRANVEDYVSCYKVDNGRLVRENNELHKQIILMRQEYEEQTRCLKAENRRFEAESEDLKIFNSQCLEKLRNYETDALKMAEQILHLQEKNFQAIVYTPGGQKKQLPFRRQRMDIDSLVPRMDKGLDGANYCCSVARHWSRTAPPTDPEALDLLDLATKRCEDLEKQVARLEEELELHERKVDNFRHKVNLRDAEIERLRSVLEGGRPLEALVQDSQERQSDRFIQQLQTQVDLLQSQNEELEARVVDLVSRATVTTQSAIPLPIPTVKSVCVQTSSCLLSTQTNSSCQTTGSTCDCQTNQMDSLKDVRNLLKKIDSGRSYLMHRVDTLTGQERDLLKELSVRMSDARTTRSDRMHRTQQTNWTKALDKRLQGLEEDCLHWRSEAQSAIEAFRQLSNTASIHYPLPDSVEPRLIASSWAQTSRMSGDFVLPEKESRLPPCPRRAVTPSPENGSSSMRRRRSASVDIPNNNRSETDTLNSQVHTVQVERDNYLCLLDQTKQILSRQQLNRQNFRPMTSSVVASTHNLLDEVCPSTELAQLRKERDRLLLLMDKFERQLSDIQSNVRVLTQERDSMSEQLHQTQHELAITRDQLNRLEQPLARSSGQLPNTGIGEAHANRDSCFGSVSSTMHRLGIDRDRLADQLREMTTERDSLRDRLQGLTDQGLREKARLLQRLEDTEEALEQQKMLHQSDAACLSDLNQRINMLETERRELLDRVECLTNYHANDNQLAIAERNLHTVQVRLDQVQQEYEKAREECTRVWRTLRQVDQEKDGLQASLDERTERCAMLERDLSKREKQLHEYQRSSQTFEQRVLRLTETTAQKDSDCRQFGDRLAMVEAELRETTNTRDQVTRELEQAKSDLATMMHEVQALQGQLRGRVEKELDFKKRLDDSAVELTRLREVCTFTEQERTNLLQQYRTLTLELDEKAVTVGRMENQLNDVQHTCSVREQELTAWRNQSDVGRKELSDYQKAVKTLESQCSLLTRAAAESEERVRRLQAENEEVHREMADMRALCDRLEHQTHSVQHRLTTGNLETDQLRAQLIETEREVSGLRKQMDHERETIRNLETVLATSRDGEFKAQQELQQCRTELRFTRERLEHCATRVPQTGGMVNGLPTNQRTHNSRQLTTTMPRSSVREPMGNQNHGSCDSVPMVNHTTAFDETGMWHTGASNSAAAQQCASSTDSMLTESHTIGLESQAAESNHLQFNGQSTTAQMVFDVGQLDLTYPDRLLSYSSQTDCIPSELLPTTNTTTGEENRPGRCGSADTLSDTLFGTETAA